LTNLTRKHRETHHWRVGQNCCPSQGLANQQITNHHSPITDSFRSAAIFCWLLESQPTLFIVDTRLRCKRTPPGADCSSVSTHVAAFSRFLYGVTCFRTAKTTKHPTSSNRRDCMGDGSVSPDGQIPAVVRAQLRGLCVRGSRFPSLCLESESQPEAELALATETRT
jgi:hypothetical protein